MGEISIVDSRIIKEEDKLNADSFRPSIVNSINVLKTLHSRGLCVRFEKIINHITNGATPYMPNYKIGKVRFLTAENIGAFEIIQTPIKYITLKDHKILKRSALEIGDLLITIKGRIGFSTVVVEKICKEMNINQDVARIVLKKNVNAYYVSAFLNSKFGRAQFYLKSVGQINKFVGLGSLKTFLIPLLSENFQIHIEQLVKQSYKKRKLAERKYQQAEELLYELLGISKEEIEKLEKNKGYETNFKDVAETFRFDAEYYHPKYLGVIELLEKSSFEIKSLKDAIEISDEKIDPTSGENKTKRFRYVPIAKINESGEIFEWDEFYGWQAPSRARMLIKENDIVIPSLAGTFDKIALVPKELDGQLTTTGCFIVRSRKDYPEFLFLLLRTPFFKGQLEQQTTGAVMSAIPKSVCGDLLIPKIPKEEQKEIARLVREYFDLRKEARSLIKQAIREVEEEIENVSSDRTI